MYWGNLKALLGYRYQKTRWQTQVTIQNEHFILQHNQNQSNSTLSFTSLSKPHFPNLDPQLSHAQQKPLTPLSSKPP
jgi:hypothetical protein